VADYKDVFNLKKRKKKSLTTESSNLKGVWKKGFPKTDLTIEDPERGYPPTSFRDALKDPNTPKYIKDAIKNHSARRAAVRQGSRPVKGFPFKKKIPRNLPPEIKPKKPNTKVGVRTGASGLSKLVKAMNK
jgi:hypothetical protein